MQQDRSRQMHEEIGLGRIQAVVDDFYARIQHHPTLAAPFDIVEDWPEHKARLSHFWWVSLGGAPYRDDRYRVAEKHLPAGLTDALVDDWLVLFRQVLSEHLPEELAAYWYSRAENMGRSLRLMSEFHAAKAARSNKEKP